MFKVPNITLEKEGDKKEKKSYYNTGYSYTVTQPNTNPAQRTGLNIVERAKHAAVLIL